MALCRPAAARADCRLLRLARPARVSTADSEPASAAAPKQRFRALNKRAGDDAAAATDAAAADQDSGPAAGAERRSHRVRRSTRNCRKT